MCSVFFPHQPSTKFTQCSKIKMYKLWVFIRRYWILVSWVLVLIVVFCESYYRYRLEARFYYLRQILGVGLCVSRASGAVINLGCALVLLPMCSALRRLVRYTGPGCLSRLFLDAGKGVHICGAYTVVVAGGLHTAAHIVNAINFSRNFSTQYPDLNAAYFHDQSPLEILFGSVSGVTGIFLVFVMCLLVVSSLHFIRSRSYDVFWYIHRLFVLFMVLIVVHPLGGVLKEQINTECFPSFNGSVPTGCEDTKPVFSPQRSLVWLWVGPSFMLYFLEVLYRCVKRRKPVADLNVILHPAAVLELRFKLEYLVKPGQYMYINCPGISCIEWHPFSISRCASKCSDSVSTHIKAKGDWSVRLQRYLMENARHNRMNQSFAKLYVDGPYNSPCEDVLKNRLNVCIAGGIGITPFAATLHYLLHNVGIPKIDRLHLIWLCPTLDSFTCFTQLLIDLHFKLWFINRPDVFDLQLYVTRQCCPFQMKSTCGEGFSFLEKRIHFKRPEWKEIFNGWKQSYTGRTVNVFTCGPKALCHLVHRHCQRMNSNSKTKFVFHRESFS